MRSHKRFSPSVLGASNAATVAEFMARHHLVCGKTSIELFAVDHARNAGA
jgi:hypothetical protein